MFESQPYGFKSQPEFHGFRITHSTPRLPISGDLSPACESPLLPLGSRQPWPCLTWGWGPQLPTSVLPARSPRLSFQLALSSSHICFVTYSPAISCLHILVTNLEHPSFTLILPLLLLIPKALPLCTGPKLNPRDRVLGEVEKNSFTRQRGTHGLLPWNPCAPTLGRIDFTTVPPGKPTELLTYL